LLVNTFELILTQSFSDEDFFITLILGVVKDETDEDEEEDSNVCTIHTIADLQHVLKSQEDIQVSLWNVNC
jgi:hypothetical protein